MPQGTFLSTEEEFLNSQHMPFPVPATVCRFRSVRTALPNSDSLLTEKNAGNSRKFCLQDWRLSTLDDAGSVGGFHFQIMAEGEQVTNPDGRLALQNDSIGWQFIDLESGFEESAICTKVIRKYSLAPDIIQTTRLTSRDGSGSSQPVVLRTYRHRRSAQMETQSICTTEQRIPA